MIAITIEGEVATTGDMVDVLNDIATAVKEGYSWGGQNGIRWELSGTALGAINESQNGGQERKEGTEG